jgi:hypothetical protein
MSGTVNPPPASRRLFLRAPRLTARNERYRSKRPERFFQKMWRVAPLPIRPVI